MPYNLYFVTDLLCHIVFSNASFMCLHFLGSSLFHLITNFFRGINKVWLYHIWPYLENQSVGVQHMISQRCFDLTVFVRYASAWMRSSLPWALWGRLMDCCRPQRIIPSLCTQWVDRLWLSLARATQVSLQPSPHLSVSFIWYHQKSNVVPVMVQVAVWLLSFSKVGIIILMDLL